MSSNRGFKSRKQETKFRAPKAKPRPQGQQQQQPRYRKAA